MYWVLQVDPRNGRMFTLDGKWATAGEEHYYAFGSLEQAEAFCMARLKQQPETGWWVFEGDERAKSLRQFQDDAYWDAQTAAAAKRPLPLGMRIRNWFKR